MCKWFLLKEVVSWSGSILMHYIIYNILNTFHIQHILKVEDFSTVYNFVTFYTSHIQL